MCLFKQKKIKWRFMGEKHHAYNIYGKSSKSIVCGAFYISYLAAVFSCKKKTKKSKGQKKWNIKTLFFSPQKYYMQHQPTTENISFQLYQNCYLAMSKTNEKKNQYCFKVPIHITLTLAGPTDFGRTRRPSNMY